MPASPGAWLTTTARRKALDRLRHLRIAEAKSSELALWIRRDGEAYGARNDRGVSPVPDDQWRLIFTCCHPALSREAQVALTLRTLAGLSIAEIAHAFLVSEAAIAQRITRAKQKIARARIPYEIPDRESLAPRLHGYLVCDRLCFWLEGVPLTRSYQARSALPLSRTTDTPSARQHDTTGFDLFRRIREQDGEVPVVAITASTDRHARARALARFSHTL